MPKRIVKLEPPLFSDSYIEEKISCIRGHRERIFEVSAKIEFDRLIINNYGQGGAGWTFLFGCVNKAINLFKNSLLDKAQYRDKPITVIGAGCYGLLTAIQLKQRGYSVKIVAQEITNITSYKAAGFFFPRHRKSSTPEEIALFQEMGLASYITYKEIATGNHNLVKAGAKILPAYFGSEIDPGYSYYIEKQLIDMPEEVIIDFGNNKQYEAVEYKTIFINPTIMMQELNRIISDLNIKIIKTKITSFQDTKLENEIIFNCAGLGAKELTGDKKIVPVQGHLISLKNQPNTERLQYMINMRVLSVTPAGNPRYELIYFSPKNSGILGITFIRGQDSITENSHEFGRILDRCRDFFGV